MSKSSKHNYVLEPRATEPKLLTLQTPTIRDQRTLIWLQSQSKTSKWNKWDGIVTSLDAYDTWSEHARLVGLILTEIRTASIGSIDDAMDKLFAISKAVPLVLLSQNVLSLKSADFWQENFDNVVNLDLILESYPFLGSPWQHTVEDAIHLFAMLCRYHRVIDCVISDCSTRSSDLVFEQNLQPNQVWVFTQFFKPTSQIRLNEIKECLRKNCECPHIDKIVLLNERDYSSDYASMKGSEKIKQVVIGDRLTYAAFLRYVHHHVPDGVYAVLTNADIYFGNSLLELWKINMTDKLFALLRWDVTADGDAKIFGPRADSQDTWIVLSDSVKNKKWDYKPFQFQLGQAGCDNAFAGHMLQQRFLLSNPALTFKTFHLHNSNIRTYDKKDYIRATIYINLVPTYLIDTKQETVPLGANAVTHLCNELVSFEVRSSSMSNEITYCTMLEKDGRYKWEPSVENHYFEPAVPVYTWSNEVHGVHEVHGVNNEVNQKGFAVTPNGLVYDLRTIYTGKHHDDPLYNFWTSTTTDILTPMQTPKRTTMLAIPFADTSIFEQVDTYITYYVSRVLRLVAMSDTNRDASFWMPPAFAPFLKGFPLDITHGLPVDKPCWAETVVGFLPGPSANEVSSEDVTCLRDATSGWNKYPSKRVCTIVVDDVLTEAVAKQLLFPLFILQGGGWTLRIVKEDASPDPVAGVARSVYSQASPERDPSIFFGSSLCIAYRSAMTASIWACPKECCFIEFQQELAIHGTMQHLAHMSEMKAWVLLLSKGSNTDVQEQMAVQLGKWLKKNSGEIVLG